MTALSRTATESLIDFMRYSYTVASHSIISQSNQIYSENNVFTRFISMDLTPNLLEIPIILQAYLTTYLTNLRSTGEHIAQRLVIHLNSMGTDIHTRTADSTIKNLVYPNGYCNRLRSVITNKRITYFGGKGLILDSNYTPLLLMSYLSSIADLSGETSHRVTGIKVSIHPSVFTNTDLISKAIINKIIPYLTSISLSDVMGSNFPDVKPIVVIEDKSSLFITPSSSYMIRGDEEINNLLQNSISSILLNLQ